jgi:hypothetical protein
LDTQTALQAVGGAHGDGAHDAVAQLLLHFQGQTGIADGAARHRPSGPIARELHVDHGADDFNDVARTHGSVLFNF